MAVTMKNVVFLDIKTQFLPPRRHITCQLQSPAGSYYVRVEVFMAVTMKLGYKKPVRTQRLEYISL
jgi:hypothetical protein